MPESMQEVNVRVAVRVRPLLPKERLANEQTCVRLVPSNNQLILGKDRAFTFDCLLSSKTSQEEVFRRCVDNLVRSCFEGYNATVFAYGQTGSGKTFTIGGTNLGSQTEEEFGVIPRAIKQMYDIMEASSEREYNVKVSYIEIYREELRDLLDLDTSSKDLHIREDDKGNTLIVGASEVVCESLDEVMSCLQRGSAFRHTGSTQMNEVSSRSHSVFTIYLEQRWSDNEASTPKERRERRRTPSEDSEISEDGEIEHYMCAKFHFVDLAGSERANRTGNVGDRFKESVHINSGLLALGNVISALGDLKKKVTHIPYRDSKITRLLKDSLGGNAQTLMFCCISPASSNFDESLNSLKYANRARNIKNKPIVNRDPHSIRFEEMQTEIRALREELNRQRTSVATIHGDSDMKLAIQEAGEIKQLDEKIARLTTECSHYKMIAEEAYKQLLEISQRDVLSESQDSRLREWLELMDEMKNKVSSSLSSPEVWDNRSISKLQQELDQCRKDLQSDEEIFAEKAREINELNERLLSVENANDNSSRLLQEALERQKQQEESLLAQQLTIEELNKQLKVKDAELEDLESCEEDLTDSTPSEEAPSTRRRAKSVPAHMLGNRPSQNELSVPSARKIHTSPALFSLERVMANFRARSQLLQSRLEDHDDVNQQRFSDDSMDAEDLMLEQEEHKSPLVRNTSSRGTYRVAKPRFQLPKKSTELENGEARLPDIYQTDDEKWSLRTSREGVMSGWPAEKVVRIVGADPQNRLDVSRLRNSTEVQKKRLKQSELEVRQSSQKMRDLAINIKMKEQLIRELVKTGQEANEMNKKYEERIQAMEKEKQTVVSELASLQKALQDVEQRDQQDRTEKDRLQSEFRKKMETAKNRITNLVRRQKETEKIATITGTNDKKIRELEQAVEKMKQQQDTLQKRLKDESERKGKLEREVAKEQQRIKELELRSRQQQKVLKVKTAEVAAFQRKMRSNYQQQSSEEQNKIDEQKRWIDTEIDKVLEQRQRVEELQKELERREDIIAKKEAMIAEKSELEMKKMRSSQLVSKDLLTVSARIDSADRKIDEKAKEIISTPRDQQSKLKEELKLLTQGRDRIAKQRDALDAKVREQAILSPAEDRRLIEIDEGIEALDAAIEYKNENIFLKQQDLRNSISIDQSEDNLLLKLNALSPGETKVLLTRYFEKVIDLRDTERKQQLEYSQLEVKVEEQETQIRELQASLAQAGLEMDRKLTQQQQEAQRKIQALMHQLMEAEKGSGGPVDPTDIQTKVQQLEKDLYYYKKTSRDLKRRLRELLATSTTPDPEKESFKDQDGAEPLRDTPKSSIPAPTPASARSSQDLLDSRGQLEGVTPVRISRRDLRRMSDEEVCLRLSQVTQMDPTDSLEASNRTPKS